MPPHRAVTGELSDRELQVVRLVAEGLSNGEIADRHLHQSQDRYHASPAHLSAARSCLPAGVDPVGDGSRPDGRQYVGQAGQIRSHKDMGKPVSWGTLAGSDEHALVEGTSR